MRNHEDVCLVPIKMVEVDEKIVPVVGWLNTYEGIHTLYSCEGYKKSKPYVMFVCDKIDSLCEALRVTNMFWGEVDTKVHTHLGVLRFTMKFETQDTLKRFCDYILKHHIEVKEWDGE